MKSPTEGIMDKASENISDPGPAASEQEKRESVLGNLDQVFEQFLRDTVDLPKYATVNDETLDVSVSSGFETNGRGGEVRRIMISGTLHNTNNKKSAKFPMYRLTRKIPASDSIFRLSPRYEISVADAEAEDGYRQLALVIGRLNRSSVSGFDFGGEFKITAGQQEQLAYTGVYTDPHGGNLISEVHYITDLALQAKAAV